MAMAMLAVAAVKAVQSYEQAQGAIGEAKTERTLGYQVADANETKVRASNAQALGEQRAQASQSGFDSTTGSLADIQTKSAGNLELDALNARYGGQLTAWRAKTQIAGAQAGFKNALATTAVAALAGGGAQALGNVAGGVLVPASPYW